MGRAIKTLQSGSAADKALATILVNATKKEPATAMVVPDRDARNSKSHRSEWMRMDWLMKEHGNNFPLLSREWERGGPPRLQLFQRFLDAGCDPNSVEIKMTHV